MVTNEEFVYYQILSHYFLQTKNNFPKFSEITSDPNTILEVKFRLLMHVYGLLHFVFSHKS